MNISLDIRYPSLPCSYLTIDAMDVSGETQTDVTHNLYKTRLDATGKVIEQAMVKVSLQPLKFSNVTSTNATTVAECESCYGAESPTHKCCPTCDDVKAAYRLKGWSLNPSQSGETIERIDFVFSRFSSRWRSAVRSRRSSGGNEFGRRRYSRGMSDSRASGSEQSRGQLSRCSRSIVSTKSHSRSFAAKYSLKSAEHESHHR